MNNELMHQVWDVELEIMDVIHGFCERNQLRYSLFYGTLLGAVRHKGFIPWDDDIDIIMPREDYERLIELWPQQISNGYLLQTYREQTDMVVSFAKVRKNHTTFLQFDMERNRKYHKGVFVDIFPADRIAPNKLAFGLQRIEAMVNMLYTRGYTSGTGGIVGAGEKLLLKMPRRFYPVIRNRAEKKYSKWNGRVQSGYMCMSTMKGIRDRFPADLFDLLQKTSFQGRSYYVTAKSDEILKTIYGDYMQFPPEEKRVWFHHPLLVDFTHNYEEIGETR